ncbi:MAG: ABC transporter ATP-binding protein [Victivallales bacterium]|nr:ABC transporter ATP-binding protein [Victivallales bacterium]
MSDLHVKINDLSKSYPSPSGDVIAVDHLDLTVPRGQFLAIMGPSGSGKSTLLHLIAGLTKPTSGSIVINDTDLSTLNDSALTRFRRRHIGMVFQAFNLIPTLTAEENVLLPVLAGFHDTDERKLQQALSSLLERLSLVPRRHHYPDQLSGGEQQRIAIARAILLDFATDAHEGLLLADEPTGNLDSANSRNICQLLRELCSEQGHTTIVVTHESRVADWADRVISFQDGKIVNDQPSLRKEA